MAMGMMVSFENLPNHYQSGPPELKRTFYCIYSGHVKVAIKSKLSSLVDGSSSNVAGSVK